MGDDDFEPTIGARGVTFENRIAIAALITAVVVLLTASVLFVFEQWQAEARNLKKSEAALAQVLAEQLAPLELHGDVQGVQWTLNALKRASNVNAAYLYDVHGREAARFVASPDHWRASQRMLHAQAPVQYRGQPVGTVVVSSRPVELAAILPRYFAVCCGLFFAAVGLALFMGRWLAGRVIDPVNRLSRTMRDVTDSADYSQRVPQWAHDEFGVLTDSFNQLLAQLQANDNALHRAMTELVEARDAAQAANVLKSQFLANMSHEIRTPLNGVLAMAQIIALGDLQPVQRERLEVIRRSGEDLLAVLNDVLDLSKIEAGKMEIEHGEVEAETLGKNVHAVFGALAAAKKNLDFTLEVRPDAKGARRGDAVRIGQILNNLVSNAIKFTGEGHVRVILDGMGEGGRDGLKFIIVDTGVGIAADKIPMLFEKFNQADGSNTRRYGGTGLGLAICRELATLMKGRIEVDSVEGEGSTFTAFLPAPRIDQTGAVADQNAGDMDDRPLRILAAEDIPTNQLVLRTILQSFGVELEMVDNGRQAVEAWEQRRFDVILMDIQMPEMDGVAATRAIRAAEVKEGRARTPIVAVSANAMAHQVKEYMAAGMDGHVAKPIELAKLHAALEAAMTKSAESRAA